MRYQELQKKLLTESGIALAALILLGGGLYFLDSMHEDAIAANKATESQLSAVTNEANGLREKYIRVQKDSELYQRIMTMDANDQLSLDTRTFESAFRDFKKRYSFGVLKYTAGDAVLQEDPKYRRGTSLIETRTVTVTFDALSDEDVYELIQAIQKELPGSAKITSLTLSRESRLTDQIVRTITKTGKFALVKGSLQFIWYGITPSDPNAAKVQKAKTRSRRR
jgi:hypothetical protein